MQKEGRTQNVTGEKLIKVREISHEKLSKSGRHEMMYFKI